MLVLFESRRGFALVIVEGMPPVLVGFAAGTIAALASARVIRMLVFGVSASDPATLAAVGATLALVALTASLVHAYRARGWAQCEPCARSRDRRVAIERVVRNRRNFESSE